MQNAPINKEAGIGDLTLPDIQGAFNKATVNPAVRSLLMGTVGYFGTKYGYRYLSDKFAGMHIRKAHKDNPGMQNQAWQDYIKRRDKMEPWLAGIGGAVGAALPLTQTIKPFQRSYKKFEDTGSLSDLSAPLFNNKLPLDRFPKISSEKSTTIEKSTMVENLLQKLADYGLPSHSPYGNPNDFALGKDFVLPKVRAIEFIGDPTIPKMSSMDLLQTQAPILGPDLTARLVAGIDNASPEDSGMISGMDIAKGLARVGVGAVAGLGLGNIMGTIFSQPPAMKSKMGNYGMIGGAILNSGLTGPILNKFKGFLQ